MSYPRDPAIPSNEQEPLWSGDPGTRAEDVDLSKYTSFQCSTCNAGRGEVICASCHGVRCLLHAPASVRLGTTPVGGGQFWRGHLGTLGYWYQGAVPVTLPGVAVPVLYATLRDGAVVTYPLPSAVDARSLYSPERSDFEIYTREWTAAVDRCAWCREHAARQAVRTKRRTPLLRARVTKPSLFEIGFAHASRSPDRSEGTPAHDIFGSAAASSVARFLEEVASAGVRGQETLSLCDSRTERMPGVRLAGIVLRRGRVKVSYKTVSGYMIGLCIGSRTSLDDEGGSERGRRVLLCEDGRLREERGAVQNDLRLVGNLGGGNVVVGFEELTYGLVEYGKMARHEVVKWRFVEQPLPDVLDGLAKGMYPRIS